MTNNTTNNNDNDDIANNNEFPSGISKQIARIGIGAYYDYQEQRKAMMNRIRDLVRKKEEGIPFDEPEPEKEEKDEYDKWTDEEVLDKLDEMMDDNEFTDEETRYIKKLKTLVEEAEQWEQEYTWFMQKFEEEPIYTKFLTHVKGIGPIHTANLVYRIGYCEDYKHVSNLWSHFGLDPQSPKQRQNGEEFSYSPELRTLAYKISDNLIRAGSLYKSEFYDPYKERQLEKMELAEEGRGDEFDGSAPESKGHAHVRAKRYMVKKFLKHYYVLARKMKGLDVDQPWVTKHGGHDNHEETTENAEFMRRLLVRENGGGQ